MSVFPFSRAGLLVRKAGRKPRVILASEINDLKTMKPRYSEPSLEIHHSSTQSNSPEVIYASLDGALALAIEELTGLHFKMSTI